MADDSYLSIAAIAGDQFMTERMNACATQQQALGTAVFPTILGDPPGNALSWVVNYRYVWASSPSWGASWTYALQANAANPDYEPGKDPACITDAQILATIQHLAAPPSEPPVVNPQGPHHPDDARRRASSPGLSRNDDALAPIAHSLICSPAASAPPALAAPPSEPPVVNPLNGSSAASELESAT